MKKPDHHERDVPQTPVLDTEILASSTECTGLTPAAVQSPQEGEAYAELYAIHQQKPAWRQEKADDSEK